MRTYNKRYGKPYHSFIEIRIDWRTTLCRIGLHRFRQGVDTIVEKENDEYYDCMPVGRYLYYSCRRCDDVAKHVGPVGQV